MKIKRLIKPVGIGLAVVAVTELAAPKYIGIAAIGAGLFVLYKVITYDDKTPIAVNVRFDKPTNKMIADIKNPSKNIFAVIPQIRLKEIAKQEEGMMAGSVESDRTTLIGEPTLPTIIGPGETVSIQCDLLIPTEMYESTDGTLSVKLSFEDPKKSLEKIAKTKVDEKMAQIEQKIEAAPPVVPKLETTEKTIEVIHQPIEIKIETEAIFPPIVAPPVIEPLEPQIETKPTLEIQTIEEDIITFVPQSEEKIKYAIEHFVEEESKSEKAAPASKGHYGSRCGKSIGHSPTMLHIIASIERLKTSTKVDNDAI